MIAIGTVFAAALGVGIGWRGGIAAVFSGLLVTTLIAVVDYFILHPDGIRGPLPSWPWGATSFIAYVFGLVAGLIASLMVERP